jgi:hypothetical protein|tara:strand:- start:41 stop:214 length:174 start_codon:yes stop_codon:yes gene_type:complete
MKFEEQCKITFEYLDEKVTIEKKAEGLTISEFNQMCKFLALGSGYDQSSVDKYFEVL